MSEFEQHKDQDLQSAPDAADLGAFSALYDSYADRIYSFCLNVLRDAAEASDATHDVFISAFGEFRQPADLERWRPRLFELARGESRAEGRRRPSNWSVPDDAGDGDDLRLLVLEAVDGLGQRDLELMLLDLVEGLRGEDLARAAGVDMSHVDDLVSRMRNRVEKAVGPLLVARLGYDDCEDLVPVLGDWGGRFDPAVRARVSRHIGVCDACEQRRALLVGSEDVLPVIMAVDAPRAIRRRVLDDVLEPTLPLPPVESGQAKAKRELSDMAMLGIFAAVTLVLGLIGLAVSAQFEPLQPPDPTAPPLAAAGTTTTTGTGPTTTTIAIGTTAPDSNTTQPSTPGAIAVSTEAIDFGDQASTAEIDLTNIGGAAVVFSIEPSVETIVLSAGGEELGPGQSITYEVFLDRETVTEGPLDESIAVKWEGGDVTISVSGAHMDNPILHNPQARPSQVQVGGGSGCAGASTTVSVRVRDRSPLDTVVVRWSPDGGSNTETAMNDVGGDIFEARIGPFTAVHTAQVRMVAIDELGNAGGATIEVPVVACS